MKRYCLTLDLRPDAGLIQEYVDWHQAVWPEIKQSIRDAGVLDMQIYLLENRLFMIMDAEDNFTFERKAEMDRENPRVLEWEQLMSRYQDVKPGCDPVKRWRLMDKVFELGGA